MAQRPPLARYFFIASVDEATEKPQVLNGLELQPGAAEEYKHAGLGNFCFPEYAEKWSPIARVTSLEAEGYTFVLTGGDGSRTLGFCRRFLPPGAGPRFPQVLCLLSAHPWFSLFSNVLKALEPYAFPLAESPTLAPGSPVAAVLRALAGAPLPPPGGLLPPPRVAGGVGLPPLRVPTDRGTGAANADVFFAPLLWRVPIPAVLNLFAALLAERRVIVTARDVSALSAAVHAAAAMLYPLQWQHIFLPVLPASLLDYLAAPMPFLVGLPAALAPAMRRLPMEEVVLLDLDTGVIECFAEDLALLPRSSGNKLATELGEALRARVHRDEPFAAALRAFFVATLGDVRRFVHALPPPPPRSRSGSALVAGSTAAAAAGAADAAAAAASAAAAAAGFAVAPPCESALRSGGLWFDHASYAAATRSQSTAAFRAALRHTQMFEAFVTLRLDALSSPRGPAAAALNGDAFEAAAAAASAAEFRLAQSAAAAKNAASAAAAAAAKRVGQAWKFAQLAGDRWAEGVERVIDPMLESAEKRVRSRSMSSDNLAAHVSASPTAGTPHRSGSNGGVGGFFSRSGEMAPVAAPPAGPPKEVGPPSPGATASAAIATPDAGGARAGLAPLPRNNSVSSDFEAEGGLVMAAHAHVVIKKAAPGGWGGSGSPASGGAAAPVLPPPPPLTLHSPPLPPPPPPPTPASQLPPAPPPPPPPPPPLVDLSELGAATPPPGTPPPFDPFAALDSPFDLGAVPPRTLSFGAAALSEQLGALGVAVPPGPAAAAPGGPDDWAELVQWADVVAPAPGAPPPAPRRVEVSLL